MSLKSRATFRVVKRNNGEEIGSVTVKSNRDFKINGKMDVDYDDSRTIKFIIKDLIKNNLLSTETTGGLNLNEKFALERGE